MALKRLEGRMERPRAREAGATPALPTRYGSSSGSQYGTDDPPPLPEDDDDVVIC